MISLTTVFWVHCAVGLLFCMPVFLTGMTGFIDVMSEGQLKPDKWHLSIFGIDFVKNLTFGMQCYFGTKMEPAAQKMLAQSMLFLCLAAAVNLYVYPTGPTPPPPAIAFLGIMTTLYCLALFGGGDKKGKKK